MPNAKPARPVTKEAAKVPAENRAILRVCRPSIVQPHRFRDAHARSRGQGNAWPVTAAGWLPTTYVRLSYRRDELSTLCPGFRAISVLPMLIDGRPMSTVTLLCIEWISGRERQALSQRVLTKKTAGHYRLQD